MDDLISRQAAIYELEEQLDYLQMLNKDENPTAESTWYGVNWARNTIADLPTAQPKKGKWIVYKAPDRYHCGLVKCQFCGEEMIAEADEYHFCPNCGADMRGEEE